METDTFRYSQSAIPPVFFYLDIFSCAPDDLHFARKYVAKYVRVREFIYLFGEKNRETLVDDLNGWWGKRAFSRDKFETIMDSFHSIELKNNNDNLFWIFLQQKWKAFFKRQSGTRILEIFIFPENYYQPKITKINDFDMQTCFQILYSFNFPCVKKRELKKNGIFYNLKFFRTCWRIKERRNESY